jgi:predicted O-methyltransferase YrrM
VIPRPGHLLLGTPGRSGSVAARHAAGRRSPPREGSAVKFDDVDAAVAGTGFMTSAQGRKVYEFIVESNLGRVLELGFAHGKSTCYLAAAADELGGNAHVLTIDRTAAMARTPNIHQLLETCVLTERVTPVVAVTSYTWELMKILERDPQPRFDFVYIDGGHTWDVTGYGFLLVDRLLAPGGWVLFDDLDWTLAASPSLANSAWVVSLSTEERTTPQARKVFQLLVQTHPEYDHVREHDGWGWARKRPAVSARTAALA